MHRFIRSCPSVSHLPVSPSLSVQWQLCRPQRDDWESVALPLQSYRSAAAGVSSSALPLCSLPHLFPLLLSSSLERLAAATRWLLWEKLLLSFFFFSPMLGLIILMYKCIFPAFHALLLHLQVSYCCSNIKLCYVTGIPILMAAIIIPSCSSQPCWLDTLRSHPTRRLMWEWHTLWGSPQPITTPLPKRTNSTRCLPGTLTLIWLIILYFILLAAKDHHKQNMRSHSFWFWSPASVYFTLYCMWHLPSSLSFFL